MRTSELLHKEIDHTPEPVWREVYHDLRFLKEQEQEERFAGLALSESALARNWNTPEEDRRVGKPEAGEVVVLPFPQSDLQPHLNPTDRAPVSPAALPMGDRATVDGLDIDGTSILSGPERP
jgi:hypothetical protein